jgi:LysR family glycine cleavage system transcriptional activator
VNREFLPSVSALLAFRSAGRHGSVTVAASELNLTQSAVSRQIRQLEDLLGISLFRRSNQRVSLTDAGRLYLKDVTAILEHLDAATRRTTMPMASSINLSLPVFPTLATRWLVPRLQDFLSQNRGITLNLSERRLPVGCAVESLDCAIACGGPLWPDTIAYPLMDESLIAVCSPKFLKQHRIRSAADFTTVTLLHETGHQSAWSDWLRRTGVKDYREPRGVCFEQDIMLSQAAVAGLGAALLPKLLVGEELACGSLVQPLEDAVPGGRSYSLVVPSSKIGSPLIQRFREWIIQQAESLRLTFQVAVSTDMACSGSPNDIQNRALQASHLKYRHYRSGSTNTCQTLSGISRLR